MIASSTSRPSASTSLAKDVQADAEAASPRTSSREPSGIDTATTRPVEPEREEAHDEHDGDSLGRAQPRTRPPIRARHAVGRQTLRSSMPAGNDFHRRAGRSPAYRRAGMSPPSFIATAMSDGVLPMKRMRGRRDRRSRAAGRQVAEAHGAVAGADREFAQRLDRAEAPVPGSTRSELVSKNPTARPRSVPTTPVAPR